MPRREPPPSEIEPSPQERCGDPSLGPLYNVSGQAVLCVRADITFARLELELLAGARFVVRIAGIRFTGEPREDWAYTMLAGPIAARMYTGVWNLAPDDEGVTRVARYLSHYPLGDPARATGRSWTALNLVEETSYELWRVWSAVESVVRDLLARKTLTADEVRALMADPPTGSARPLVPTADEVLRELEVVLRQNHDLELGDWRACPREAPMPFGPPILEPVLPGEAFRQQTLRARPKPPSKPVKPTRKPRRPRGAGAG